MFFRCSPTLSLEQSKSAAIAFCVAHTVSSLYNTCIPCFLPSATKVRNSAVLFLISNFFAIFLLPEFYHFTSLQIYRHTLAVFSRFLLFSLDNSIDVELSKRNLLVEEIAEISVVPWIDISLLQHLFTRQLTCVLHAKSLLHLVFSVLIRVVPKIEQYLADKLVLVNNGLFFLGLAEEIAELLVVAACFIFLFISMMNVHQSQYSLPQRIVQSLWASAILTYFQSQRRLKAESIGNKLWSLVFIVAQMYKLFGNNNTLPLFTSFVIFSYSGTTPSMSNPSASTNSPPSPNALLISFCKSVSASIG